MKKRATYSRLMQSTNWQKIRRSVLRETPLCADCLENGINTSATEIHHIRPVETAVGDSEMESLCFDRTNLVALCHDGHVERHRLLKSHSKESVKANARRATEAFNRRFFEE